MDWFWLYPGFWKQCLEIKVLEKLKTVAEREMIDYSKQDYKIVAFSFTTTIIMLDNAVVWTSVW